MFNWAKIQWRQNDLPYSAEFQDVYYQDYGWQESQYVSLLQSSIFQDLHCSLTPIIVAEIGFGSGLNFLACVDLWEKQQYYRQSPLIYISFESHPMTPADRSRASSRWVEASWFDKKLTKAYCHLVPGVNIRYFPTENVFLILIIGQASEQIKKTSFKANHWILDGFCPKKNPETWQQDLLASISSHSVVGASLGTFSVYGPLRRNLQALGWQIHKVKGFAAKRHCLRGFFREKYRPIASRQKRVAVLGNGISALCSRYFFSLCSAQVAGQRTSHFQASSVPLVTGLPAFHSHLSEYTLVNLRSWSLATSLYEYLATGHGWKMTLGLEHKPQSQRQIKKMEKCLLSPFYHQFFYSHRPQQFFFPRAFEMHSKDIQSYFHSQTNLCDLFHADKHNYQRLKEDFDQIILANSLQARVFEPSIEAPGILRGQLPASKQKGERVWGKPSFDRYNFQPLPQSTQGQTRPDLVDFVGFRAQTSNHLPLVQQLSPNVYVNIYHGSRGYTTGLWGGLTLALRALDLFDYIDES